MGHHEQDQRKATIIAVVVLILCFVILGLLDVSEPVQSDPPRKLGEIAQESQQNIQRRKARAW